MMLVSTYIGPSRINGLGLFAAESIPKGTCIWRHFPKLDHAFTMGEFKTFPEIVQAFIRHYGYHEPVTGMVRLSFDNDRFINFSDTPNIDGNEEEMFASKDIQAHEEITYSKSGDLWSMEEKDRQA